MTRIALIGNSHIGFLKNAWTHGLAQRYSEASIDFFPDRSKGVKPLYLRGKNKEITLNEIKLPSEWKNSIAIDDYDAFGVVGLHFSYMTLLSLYRQYRTTAHRQQPARWLVSAECFHQAARGALTATFGYRLQAQLRGITDKPIILIPTPRLSEYIFHNDTKLVPNSGSAFARQVGVVGDADALDKLYSQLMQELETPLLKILDQPAESRIGAFSKGEFSLAHPPVSDNKWFVQNDFYHMNESLGELVIPQLMQSISLAEQHTEKEALTQGTVPQMTVQPKHLAGEKAGGSISQEISPVLKTASSRKAWMRSGVDWFSNQAADQLPADAEHLVYQQAYATAQNPYLLGRAEFYGRTGSAQGLKALLGGRLLLTNDGQVSVRLSGFDWHRPGIEDRSQLWVLQQWLCLRDVLYEKTAGTSRDSRVLIGPWIRAWADVNLTPESISTNRLLAWHDHTTALRVIHCVSYLLMLAEAEVSIEVEFPRLLDFVGLHIKILSAEDFYSRHTNHGFDQAVALYLLCSVFDLGELTRSGKAIARHRLIDEMRIAFNEEGIHIENSPGYHPLMLSRLLHARRLLDAFGDGAEGLNVQATYDKGLEFLLHALRPDGIMPILGDTSAMPLRFDLDDMKRKDIARYLQYALTAGREGEMPVHRVRIFPRAGYAFIRDRWGSAEDYQDVVHIAVKNGFLSTYHRHDDDNTVLLYAFGEEWLIGSGIYKYLDKDPYRLYLRSSRAKNIVSVEGVEASRQVATTGPRSSFLGWKTVEGLTQLRLRSWMYPGFCYERELSFSRSELALELVDRVDPVAVSTNNYQLRLHLPADKAVEQLRDGTILVHSKRAGHRLRIKPVQDSFDDIEVASGQGEPDIAGWTSPAIGCLDKATTIIFHARQRQMLRSHLRLQLSKGS